jgi:hypothetical protein
MEMQRQLKDSIEALTKETAKARRATPSALAIFVGLSPRLRLGLRRGQPGRSP